MKAERYGGVDLKEGDETVLGSAIRESEGGEISQVKGEIDLRFYYSSFFLSVEKIYFIRYFYFISCGYRFVLEIFVFEENK